MIRYRDLLFKPIEREDLPWLLYHRNRDELRRYFREYREMNIDMITEWFDRTQCGNKDFAHFVTLKKTRSGALKNIGIVSLNYIDWRNSHCEIGIFITDDLETKKGNGSTMISFIKDYGFGELNLNRIWIDVYDNNPDVPFWEKNGFTWEGILRENYYHNGKYYDSHVGSILRSEWENCNELL